MAIARSLSPHKQAIILQQGAIELSLGKNEAARISLKKPTNLIRQTMRPKSHYIASLFYTKKSRQLRNSLRIQLPNLYDWQQATLF